MSSQPDFPNSRDFYRVSNDGHSTAAPVDDVCCWPNHHFGYYLDGSQDDARYWLMFLVFTDMSKIKAIRSFPTEAEMDGYCSRYMEIAPEDTVDHRAWRETHNMPALVVFEAASAEAIGTWRDIQPFAIYLAGKRWNCVPVDEEQGQ